MQKRLPTQRREQAEKKKRSSPDYPFLARKLFEASGNDGICKLPAWSKKDEAPEPKPAPGLYVVATPIGNLGDISLRALRVLADADISACEDTRLSGAMLAKYGLRKPLLSYHDHNADARRPEILAKITAGSAVALISDAGMPLIADPGYKLVRACQDLGLGVTVIPGANAALTALAGSGLPSDGFYFGGFLPARSAARQKAITALKSIPATLILYEAPQRLAACLGDLATGLGPERPAAVARELTKLFEETRRDTLEALASYYRENAARGEIVILVGPPLESAAVLHDVDALLQKSLETNSLRDAVADISELTGIRKSEVYKIALKLAGRRT